MFWWPCGVDLIFWSSELGSFFQEDLKDLFFFGTSRWLIIPKNKAGYLFPGGFHVAVGGGIRPLDSSWGFCHGLLLLCPWLWQLLWYIGPICKVVSTTCPTLWFFSCWLELQQNVFVGGNRCCNFDQDEFMLMQSNLRINSYHIQVFASVHASVYGIINSYVVKINMITHYHSYFNNKHIVYNII